MDQPSLNLCRFSRKIALNTTSVYVDAFTERLFPVFNHIDDEATAAANSAWEAAMSSPLSDDGFDPGDFAEAAQERGLEVYENLAFTRQQLLGLAAAGLYHLWERLLKQFICKELRGWKFGGRTIHQLMAPANFDLLKTFLSEFGYRLEATPYFADLNELRLIANVVKHGDGSSCEALQVMAPRLFEGYHYHFDIFSKAESLALKAEDFHRYTTAIRSFWETFPETLTATAKPVT